jgi:hypothetical protein
VGWIKSATVTATIATAMPYRDCHFAWFIATRFRAFAAAPSHRPVRMAAISQIQAPLARVHSGFRRRDIGGTKGAIKAG